MDRRPPSSRQLYLYQLFSRGPLVILNDFSIYYAFFDHGEKPVCKVRDGLVGWYGICRSRLWNWLNYDVSCCLCIIIKYWPYRRHKFIFNAMLFRNNDQRLTTDQMLMIQHEQIAIIMHIRLQYIIYLISSWMWTFGFPKLVTFTQGWLYGGWTWHGWTHQNTTRTIPPNRMAMLFMGGKGQHWASMDKFSSMDKENVHYDENAFLGLQRNSIINQP